VYSRAPRLLWWLPTGAVTLFCIVPFIALAHRAIGPDWPARAVGTAALRQVWWFTTWQAAASTALTLALALPVTWAVARHRVPGGRALTAGLTVPFLLPSVVVGAAFLALLPRTMHGTAPAILLAHAWFNLAVVVRVVGPRWSSIDPALGEAAATLGARPATVARTVTAPLLAPAVASASAVVFVLCFTSYGVVRLLGGAARATVESEIVLRAVLLDDLPTAVALAAAQFAVVGTAVFWWTARGTRAATRPVERVAPRHARGPRVVAVLAIVTAAWLVATLPLVAIAIRSVNYEVTREILVRDIELGTEQTLDTLSGGESVWVRKALYDAFGIIRAQNTGLQFLTVFLDEADGALDPDARRRYIAMLQAEHAAAVDKAVFPGWQGGPLEHVIAGKAVAFREAASPMFKAYAAQVVANASALAEALADNGFRLVSGGTDCHLMVVDLRPFDAELTGKEAQAVLDLAGITLNKNTIPDDPRSPFVTSGVRIGTPSVTTQGMGEKEMATIASLIARALRGRGAESEVAAVRAEVAELCKAFPAYPAGV
jgi:ABC-type spermidine/putrescine transport system permease subunit II